jgi:hypothetical protein
MDNKNIARRRRSTFAVTVLVATAAGIAAIVLSTAGASSAPGSGTAATSSPASRAVVACLSQRGHSVTLEADDPLVLNDAEYAAVYGYGISVPVTGSLSSSSPITDELSKDLGECADDARADPGAERLDAAYASLRAALTKADMQGFADMDAYLVSLPGVADSLGAWRDCMARSGHDVENPAVARAGIERRFADLGDADKMAARRIDGAKPAEPSAALRALQADERAVAVADRQCLEREVHPVLIAAIGDVVARR